MILTLEGFDKAAPFLRTALEFDMSDYTISPARYAKNMMAVRTPSTDGWKTRAARLAENLARGRYTNREGAYLMSRTAAEKFKRLYAEGWDASVISNKLEAPRNEPLS